MARLRSGKCYRAPKNKAYTRKSKYQKKSFVKGIPGSKIVMFDMGDRSNPERFAKKVSLIVDGDVQIRHNALEASRVAVNKHLNKKLGKKNYYFKIKAYPHHVMRENPIAGGAGADRYSTGMGKKPFGKPIGYAARLKKGQEIMYVRVNEHNIAHAKEALRKSSHKLPVKCRIVIN